MSEGIEALGGGVADAMLARAVEPGHGEANDEHIAARCLNCGAFLSGPYCNRCGQKAHLHRTISDFWHDLLHGVLHFDGKFWRTLPLLAWHPGELTRRYIHGERARFVSPLALFLFAVFVTFAVFQYGGGHHEVNVTAPSNRAEAAATVAEMREDLKRLDEKIASAKARRGDTSALEQERANAQLGLDVVEAAGGVGIINAAEENAGGETAAAKVEGSPVTVEGSPIAIAWLQGFVSKLKKNPDLLLYKMQSYAYKYAWALIPLSAAWLWLLFAFDRRHPFYDHIVFVTYSIGFMMLFATSLVLLTRLGLSEEVAIPIFFLYAPYHIYRQLKGAYRGGHLATFVRTLAILIGAFFILLAFGSLLVALGIG